MSRRKTVKIISYLAAAFIVLIVVLIMNIKELRFYKNQVRYTYSQAFSELSDSMNNISINLEKAKYVTTEKQINSIAEQMYTEAKIAKAAFAKFPSSDKYGEKLNEFLSQVGNYSTFLANKIISGSQIEKSERENLEKLSSISKKISQSVQNAHDNFDSSGKLMKELGTGMFDDFEGGELSDSFSQAESALTDYPTLIYDGPYSDYISLKPSVMLENAQVVTSDEAKNILADFLGISADKINYDSFESGNLACYHFSFENGTAAVSEKGGYLVYFRKYTKQGEQLFSYEQAVNKAQKVLSKSTGKNFISTYYFADNGVCVVNFAYKSGAAICYTDLIKIGVDLASGDVVLYEGRGYLTNHTERTLPTPSNSLDKASEVLSAALTVKSYALAVIPTDGGYEKQCYEFVCETEEKNEIIVYINTETLQEEQIFILLNTSGGTLVK